MTVYLLIQTDADTDCTMPLFACTDPEMARDAKAELLIGRQRDDVDIYAVQVDIPPSRWRVTEADQVA